MRVNSGMRKADKPMGHLHVWKGPGMAGEPYTSKDARAVRWGGHRNLDWQQSKALGPHPTFPT